MSIAVALDDELDISRGDMLVHPKNRPAVQSTFEAMVVWMAEAPMRVGRPYLVKHTTRTAKAVVERVEYRVDVNKLSRSPAGALGLNEIGRLVLQSTQGLFLDAYERNRVTGSLILIDPISNDTVAAGMVIDSLRQNELRLTRDRLAAAPRSERRDDVRPVSAGIASGSLASGRSPSGSMGLTTPPPRRSRGSWGAGFRPPVARPMCSTRPTSSAA